MKTTLKEFGAQLRCNKKIQKRYGAKLDKYSDEELAEKHLELYPEKRQYISDPPPTALMKTVKASTTALVKVVDAVLLIGDTPDYTPQARLRDLAMTPVTANKSWYESYGEHAKTVAQQVENRTNTIRAVEYAAVAEVATTKGLTVEGYMHAHDAHLMMQVETHKANEQIRVAAETAKNERDIGLDGMDRRKYGDYRAQQLEEQIFDLIERSDNERHPRKKAILEKRIKKLEEQLDGLEGLVPAGHGRGLPSSDTESDGTPRGREGEEGDPQPVTVKGFGVDSY